MNISEEEDRKILAVKSNIDSPENGESFFLKGLDKAIAGVTYDNRVIYDLNKIFMILTRKYKMTEEKASAHMRNVISKQCSGDNSPILMEPIKNFIYS